MRLRAVVAVVVLTALTMAPAGAGDAGKARRAIVSYALDDDNHSVGLPGEGLQAGAYDEADSYAFTLRKGETAVSVMVLDDGESEVSAVIAQRVRDGGAGGVSYGHFGTYEAICTRTEAPVGVLPDVEVEIYLQKGTCEDGTPSLPTAGDIVVDFHRAG